MNNSIKKYLKELKKSFPAFQKEEKTYYNKLKKSISNEYHNNKSITYEECIERFGKPNDLVDSYYEEMDEDILKSRIKHTSFIKKCILSAVILIIGFSIFTFAYELYRFETLRDEVRQHQPVTVETTITED
jgi:hypothetical protein